MTDKTADFQQQVETALNDKNALRIVGGDSKKFLGNYADLNPLLTTEHTGIISYEPSELVVTVRSGTTLSALNKTLNEHNQMLAFEPPSYTDNATIGGTVACNLSGPGRAFNGACRDHLLGTTIINGKAEVVHFGGQVMKNVAGYDVSRLMCGAMGTLGLLLEVSLKVLPVPENTVTLVFDSGIDDAIQQMNHFASRALPITAACYHADKMYIRLAGNESAVNDACRQISADSASADSTFWQQLRDLQHDFFKAAGNLWRLSVPAAASHSLLEGDWFLDWRGGQRWLKTDLDALTIREYAKKLGGHATSYTPAVGVNSFHELPGNLVPLHRRLKKAFDPDNIFNPGRMYKDI